MPKAKKAPPAKPVAPAPPPKPEPIQVVPDGREVVYPDLIIEEYSTTSKKGPLDADWCKQAMGWETEPEYQARKVAENPGSKPEHFLFGETGPKLEEADGGGFQPIHCRNINGEKVVCWNNGSNRPFDEAWCDSLVHTILQGQWAGPFTIPGETVNGETVRISKYGRILSGQHQMTALIKAAEVMALARANGTDKANDPKWPVWAKQPAPFIETIVVKGMSEDARVLMTVDYNKPRTAADVFYTSELFKSATSPERKELCRMLASAVDTLWTRTDTKGYRTHPEVVAFLERHKRLLKCVEHIFSLNSSAAKRKIAQHHLQPGPVSALMYLMGSSGSDDPEYGDVYRNETPPSEKNLDWSLWDRAKEFWSGLVSTVEFEPVRKALGLLVTSAPDDEENQGLGGRNPEKFALLAAAWETYKAHPANAGPAFTEEDREPGGVLCLSYHDLDSKGNKLPAGQVALVDVADFYGIDCPEVIGRGPTSREAPMPPLATGEEYERLKEAAKERHQKKQ